jgi:2'-5' RNA ligase
MSLLRAFIAIELPAQVCDAIQKQTTRLRQILGDDLVRWIPTQNMHLTLKFLGDINTSHLEFLKQLLAREADSHPQFNLQLGGLGSFPNSRKPRLLWIGIQTPTDLASPHLTIGRVRQTVSPQELQKIRTALDTIQLGNIGIARVDSVHLFKSDLQPSGSIYTKLFSAPLSKP